MAWLLLKNKLRAARAMGAKLSTGQKVTAFISQLVILGFMLFLGAGFKLAFYLLGQGVAGQTGPVVYLLDHLFFLIFALAVISGAISSLYSMFKTGELDFLFGLPLDPRAIFDYLLVQNMLLTVWPVIIVGLPLVGALVVEFKISLPVGFVMVVGLLPLTVTAEALGALLAIGGTRAFRGLSRQLTVGLVAILGVGVAFFLADAVAPSRLDHLVNTAVVGGADFIRNPRIDQPWMPNYWLSLAYKSGMIGRPAEEATAIGMLVFLTVLAVGVSRYLGARLFLDTWLRSRENPRRARGEMRRRFPRFIPGLRGALVERDYLVFSRSSNEISQAGFFFMLVLILVFVISRYSSLPAGAGVWSYRAVVLLFGVIVYYLAMLANRFIFPSLSMEGRSFWILVSSPLELRELVAAKLAYSVAILTVLGAVLALVSAYFFQMAPLLTGIMLLWVGAAGVVVAAIALTGGILYPDFSRRNAAEISSSLAGLAATVATLIYGAAAMALFAPVVGLFYLGEERSLLIPIAANLALSLAIFVTLWRVAARRLAGDFPAP